MKTLTNEEIKQAIEVMQNEIETVKECIQVPDATSNKVIGSHQTALQALQNELERAEGCGWCKKYNRSDKWECTPLGVEGEYLTLENNILMCTTADYCPICGKKLIEED